MNDTNTLIIKKDQLTNVGQVAVEVIGFTLKIMDGTGPRNVPGTVCIVSSGTSRSSVSEHRQRARCLGWALGTDHTDLCCRRWAYIQRGN